MRCETRWADESFSLQSFPAAALGLLLRATITGSSTTTNKQLKKKTVQNKM
jgi:hypothetical protein